MIIRKTKVKKLEKQDTEKCVYSPVKPNTLKMEKSIISIISPHEYCNHKHYCIFNKNRAELEKNIYQLEKELTDFENIKNAAINGEIIYHKELDSYYNINIDEYTGIDGKIHFKTDIQITDKFMGAINTKIKNLKYDLENLKNFRLDILHGKVEGYGI